MDLGNLNKKYLGSPNVVFQTFHDTNFREKPDNRTYLTDNRKLFVHLDVSGCLRCTLMILRIRDVSMMTMH